MALPAAELAYAAGLFEGEGCIQIVRTSRSSSLHPKFFLACSVSMCDTEPLVFLHDRWGGAFKPVRRIAGAERWRASHRWTASTQVAARFLRDVAPYFLMERMRLKASLALEFQDQKRIGRQPDDYRERQHVYHSLMKQLNRRGAGSLSNEERAALVGDIARQTALVLT